MKKSFISSCAILLVLCTLNGCKSATPTQEDMLLAKHAVALAKQTENTPGRYVGNYITKCFFGRRTITILEGKREATQKQLSAARKSLEKYIFFLELAQNWPAPLSVNIPYATKTPIINGNLNDPAWENALTFKGVYLENKTVRQDTPETVWKIMWDENNIYFGAHCHDKNIIAKKIKNPASLFGHDNLEIFLMTNLRTGSYWEFVVDARGNVFDSLATANRDRFQKIARHGEVLRGAQVCTVVNGTLDDTNDQDQSFTIEIALPFSELPGFMKGNKPKGGEQISFMMARTAVSSVAGKKKMYTMQPVLKSTHNTWNYVNARLCK